MKKLKIVSIAAEVDPFSKSGGLADVARSLPKSLHRLGHEVIIITPFYGRIIDKEKHHLQEIYQDVNLHIDKANTVKVSYYRGNCCLVLKFILLLTKSIFPAGKIYMAPVMRMPDFICLMWRLLN